MGCYAQNYYYCLCDLSKNLKIKIYKTIILAVVLYGCEAWSLTLREECNRKKFKNEIEKEKKQDRRKGKIDREKDRKNRNGRQVKNEITREKREIKRRKGQY